MVLLSTSGDSFGKGFDSGQRWGEWIRDHPELSLAVLALVLILVFSIYWQRRVTRR
jgi:hypothetical protein